MHPETERAGRTCSLVSLGLHVTPALVLGLGTDVDMAVCCILSALAVLWQWDQSITQGSQTWGLFEVAVVVVAVARRWGGGLKGVGWGPGLHCSQAPRRHEVSTSPTPSATWETRGRALSHPVWNVMQLSGMYDPWNVEVAVGCDVVDTVPVLTLTDPNAFSVVLIFSWVVLMQCVELSSTWTSHVLKRR